MFASEVIPTPEVAREAGVALKALYKPRPKTKRAPTIRVVVDEAKTQVTIPRAAYDLLLGVLAQLANGNPVSIVPHQAELTTNQAAEMLNVSRPFLIQLLEKGELPFRMVGTHRRIRYEDLLKYKRNDDAKRKAVADELAAEARKMGFEY
ncbi:MAG: helix-turn-helix domain-containing protein [Deltaproteobacteria bacterium]|nr:helix-turn-helix domain-containing protein [Deltaproteobacteria bacterium]